MTIRKVSRASFVKYRLLKLQIEIRLNVQLMLGYRKPISGKNSPHPEAYLEPRQTFTMEFF